MKKKFSDSTFLLMVTIGLFVLIYAAGMIVFADKGFAKPQMFANLFISNAGLIVIALALTIVMISGGIDISVGSVTALVAMSVAYSLEVMGLNLYLSLLLAILIGVVFGLFQGYLIAYLEIQPFIVTLAGMFLARGLTAIVSKDMISIKNEAFLSWANYKIYIPFIGSVSRRGEFQPIYIYPTVIVALIILVIVVIMLRYTKFGRSIFAVGGNQQSASMMGINVRRVKLMTYVVSGLLVGIGAFLFTLNTGAGFVEQAKGLEMEAISSSIIGGTLLSGGIGSPVGSLFGVLIKGTLASLITTQGTLSSWWVRISLSALLCFFIVIQTVITSRSKKKGSLL